MSPRESNLAHDVLYVLAPLGNYAPAERLIEINLLFSHLERAEVK
jgi:hypothetical protein